MGECIIAMESATIAKKGIRALAGDGIACSQVSIDPTLTRRGCGFGISVPCGSLSRATERLHRRNIPFGEVLGGV